jgi:single-stranded DNA-binding protein
MGTFAVQNTHSALKSAQQVVVEGPLRKREWESNGRSNRRMEIVASRVQFLGTPPAGRIETAQNEDLAVAAESEKAS